MGSTAAAASCLFIAIAVLFVGWLSTQLPACWPAPAADDEAQPRGGGRWRGEAGGARGASLCFPNSEEGPAVVAEGEGFDLLLFMRRRAGAGAPWDKVRRLGQTARPRLPALPAFKRAHRCSMYNYVTRIMDDPLLSFLSRRELASI